jgi:predicted TIM-barrel fold metal-dependent hydrolase
MIEAAKEKVFGRIFAPDHDWLAKRGAEDILEPDLPIVDAHHHFWDARGRRYMLEEWRADVCSGHKVEATVYIECQSMYRADGPVEMRPVGEVEFAAGLAAISESGRYGSARAAAAIVGQADLTLAEAVAPVLDAMEGVGGGRFRGIRHAAGWDADPRIGNSHTSAAPGLYQRADFRAGVDCLSARGLSFDALVFHPQIDELTDLARACPEANIIVNHCCLPLGHGPYAGKGQEVHTQWLASMTGLAACPNVSMKLGGMVMRLAAFDYHNAPMPPSSAELADLWRPFIEPCISLFGAERCMFESNFPVDKMGIGFAGLWNAFKHLAAGASAAEKQSLFAGTARRVYRLAP